MKIFKIFVIILEADILKIKNDCKFLPPLFCQQVYEKEMKRRKLFKDENIDNNSLTSILVHTPNNSPVKNGVLHLAVPKKKSKPLNQIDNTQYQDAEEDIPIISKTNDHLRNQVNNQLNNQVNNQVNNISKVINNTVDTKDILNVEDNLVQNNSDKTIKNNIQLPTVNNYQI